MCITTAGVLFHLLLLLTSNALHSAGLLLGHLSLLMLPEPQHKYLRNLIMPAFTNEAIERLVPRMEAVLQRYLDAWADAGAPVKAHNELRHMTFEFIVAVSAVTVAVLVVLLHPANRHHSCQFVSHNHQLILSCQLLPHRSHACTCRWCWDGTILRPPSAASADCSRLSYHLTLL